MKSLEVGEVFTVESKFATNPKTTPFAHQIEATEALLKHKAFAIFSEMGTGKSKSVIDAACLLAERGEIDTVVIVCPASVRSVWTDQEIGEIAKHTWRPSWVGEFHGKMKEVWRTASTHRPFDNPGIFWLVTNYEFLRGNQHLSTLLDDLRGHTTLLVLDESSYIKSRTAAQTKAVMKLRQHCARVVLLNGTPIVNNPLDLFSQMKVLDPSILGDNYWFFRSKYCEMVPQKFGNGPRFNKIVGYKNLDELQERIKPHCLRRLKKDCLDLPEKLYTVLEVALTTESWKRYQELKREAVISLGNGDLRLEPNAAVRIMRLGQLTSGILGGSDGGSLSYPENGGIKISMECIDDLSSEKLEWAVQYLTEECAASHIIIWCRWRRERERLSEALKDIAVCQIYGGQSKNERDMYITEFQRPSSRRCVLLAQPHTGGFGLNLQVATEEWFLSNDWSYGVRLQAEDRAHRPGQKSSVLIGDVLATGPAGQRTIDHIIFKALRDKASLAEMTCGAWRKALEEIP